MELQSAHEAAAKTLSCWWGRWPLQSLSFGCI